MKQRSHELLTFVVVFLFLGLAFLLFLIPEEKGEATKNIDLENKFKEYFLLSAMINHQTNNAIHQMQLETIEYGHPKKAAQEYFRCDILKKNMDRAKELRRQIMNEFDYLSEMNCFHEVSEADLRKFLLLEQQCSNPRLDPQLPEKIVRIYNYQKEALNSGCMKQTELFELLRTTQIVIINPDKIK